MFGAEWKKIMRNRGFLILTTVLLAANLMLFFYRQQTVHRNWLYSVPYYKEYQQKIAGMDVQKADAFLMEETVKLGDFQTICQVLDGEIPEEVLEFLEMENPGILEEFRNSEYADSPKKLEGRMTAAGELQRQMAYIRAYPEYIASIRDNFEDMKKNSFYDGRPYQERLGEKMVADFAGLEKLPLEPGPEYGILSVLENTSADAFLLLLVIYVCTVSIVPEKNRNLFGLVKKYKVRAAQTGCCQIFGNSCDHGFPVCAFLWKPLGKFLLPVWARSSGAAGSVIGIDERELSSFDGRRLSV